MDSETCFPVRQLRHPGSDNDVEIRDETCVIKFKAFQQELVIDLRQDSSFIAPSMRSTWLPDLQRCFYSGHVNGDRDSYAALSLCRGVNGAFGFQGWEYFISPAQNGTRSAQVHNHAHTIRRRRSADLTRGSRCAVDNHVSLSAARSLEKHKHVADLNVNETTRRAKRFASVPRFVETLVVADESMAHFHGDELKHYLLTLMAVAARLYRHPSILNSISITVVKIIIIHEEDKGPKVSGNAAMTLRNFCTWQKKLNKQNDKQPDYWDTAILFTREVKSEYRNNLANKQTNKQKVG